MFSCVTFYTSGRSMYVYTRVWLFKHQGGVCTRVWLFIHQGGVCTRVWLFKHQGGVCTCVWLFIHQGHGRSAMKANEANECLTFETASVTFESKSNVFFLQNLCKFTPFASLYSDPAYGRAGWSMYSRILFSYLPVRCLKSKMADRVNFYLIG